MRSHAANGSQPKEIELDTSWTSSILEQNWNAARPIVFEFFVADDTFEGGAVAERHLFDDFELIGESYALEGGATLESASANSLEVFVEDDALEGGAFAECYLFDDFEVIGEGYALEGGTVLECAPGDSREVFVEDVALEGSAAGERRAPVLAAGERQIFEYFELIGESDTREGEAFLEYSRS